MKKYWDDAFVFDFEARVKEVIEEPNRLGLIFDETYFYPEGGGQPSDRGEIAAIPLLDVQEQDDIIIHYLPRTPEALKHFTPGLTVPCAIDKQYRINNMRIHTTCHLLFGAARKMFTEVGYAGFNIGEVGNLYLETPRQIRSDDLREMATLANEVVVEDRPISARLVDPEDARKMKDLAYNIELPKGKVRIVTVEGWDVAACSGTHMRRTVELGPIKIIAREIHKKNVTRIDYAIGKRSVAEMAKEEKTLIETAEFLSTSKDQVSQIVRKLSDDLQSAQKDLRKMRERVMDYRINELRNAGEMVNGVCLITDIVDYLDAGAVKSMATKLLTGTTKTVVAIIGGSGDLSLAAGCSPDMNLIISQPIVAIAKKYGGGGGGRPTFVTAGGIQWSAGSLMEEVKAELIKLLA